MVIEFYIVYQRTSENVENGVIYRNQIILLSENKQLFERISTHQLLTLGTKNSMSEVFFPNMLTCVQSRVYLYFVWLYNYVK